MAWPGCRGRGCGRVSGHRSGLAGARGGRRWGCPSLVEQKSVGIFWTHLLLRRQIFIQFGLFSLQGTRSSLATTATTPIVILQQRKRSLLLRWTLEGFFVSLALCSLVTLFYTRAKNDPHSFLDHSCTQFHNIRWEIWPFRSIKDNLGTFELSR